MELGQVKPCVCYVQQMQWKIVALHDLGHKYVVIYWVDCVIVR